MLIAQAKKEENIVEYVLYMFQLHDILRGLKFDEKAVREKLAKPMAKSFDQEEEILNWYKELIAKMASEGLQEKGFVSDVLSKVGELTLLHGMLLQQLNDEKYKAIYNAVIPFVNEYKLKSNEENVSDILICLNALYAKLLLKLKKVEISEASDEAFIAFSNLLSYIAIRYKEMYQGKLSFSLN
jgi:hypothetical protein